MSLVMQPCDLEQDMTTLFESPEQTTELTNSPQRLLDEIVHSRPNEMVETRSDDENLSVAQNIVQRMKILVQPELGEIDESNEEMKNFALVKKNPEAEEMELFNLSIKVKEEEDRFIQALKEYEESAKDKYKTGININEMHSLDEIWTMLDTPVEKYQKKDIKGFWGHIRLAFRKLGEYDKPITGWLGLIPSENVYLSLVCGGLQMILKAAARMKEVADEILDALIQIPTILSGAQRVLVLYKDSQKLQACSSTLYMSIIQGLGYIISHLRGNSSSRFKNSAKAFAQQSNYRLDIDKKIKAIKESRDAFNTEADICHKTCQKQMITKMGEMAENERDTAKDFQVKIDNMAKVLKIAALEKQRTLKEIDESLRIIEKRTSEISGELATMKDMLLQLQAMTMYSPNVLSEAIAKAIADYPRLDAPAAKSPTQLAICQKTTSQSPKNHRRLAIRQKNANLTVHKPKKLEFSEQEMRTIILSRLHYDESRSRENVSVNYSILGALSREDQQRCMHAVQSSSLGSWVSSTQSTLLAIHGNSTKPQRRSPMSLLCAKLIYTIEVMKTNSMGTDKTLVFPLHFFCGEHSDSEKWNSPLGVTNSLLAQLVSQCKTDSLLKLIEIGDFDGEDMRAVFQRFEFVLANLPRAAVVFCVVDALSFYIDDIDMVDEAEALISWLVQLSRGEYGESGRDACIFKLLVTAPFRLHGRAFEELNDDEVMIVPRILPTGTGLTDMKWELSIGDKLEGMS